MEYMVVEVLFHCAINPSLPVIYTGRNFGKVTSGVTSSKTSRTGIPTRTSCHGHSMTLLIIIT